MLFFKKMSLDVANNCPNITELKLNGYIYDAPITNLLPLIIRLGKNLTHLSLRSRGSEGEISKEILIANIIEYCSCLEVNLSYLILLKVNI